MAISIGSFLFRMSANLWAVMTLGWVVVFAIDELRFLLSKLAVTGWVFTELLLLEFPMADDWTLCVADD